MYSLQEDFDRDTPGTLDRLGAQSVCPFTSCPFTSFASFMKPARKFVVYAGADRFPMGAGVEAIGLRALMDVLSKAGN
jgi:hypothetical protein